MTPPCLRVLRPGVLSTVQDAGRHGLRHLGVVCSGPMDAVAHELANALVGNAPGAAALEFTVIGPELEFSCDALVALCGARFEARVDAHALPADRPVFLRAGARLAAGSARHGSRAYLAVAGGIAVPEVLGSRSTFLPARFGGHQGRALRAGDEIALAQRAAGLAAARYARLGSRRAFPGGLASVSWSSPSLTLPEHEPVPVHAIEGRHYGLFDENSKRAFFDAEWRVLPESNRMGLRLAGPALARSSSLDIPSEPTCMGTVQVPAGGLPIALMADHQTTGGYPRIAEVAGADLPRLAQLAPGARVRFARASLAEAHELRRALRERLGRALRTLQWSYGA